MSHAKPVGGKIFSGTFRVALILAVVAAILLAKRFMYGLGAVSNMSDGYPWGIWIAYDVVVGTALACGGYAVAILVYILNRGEYYPLVRPALMASLFGYTLAVVSVFFDIGRYWQGYNVFLPQYGNPNSVMFEVALCVMLYVAVLWVEFMPVLAEGSGKHETARTLNKIMFVFIGLGVLLPTMHQSSLGTLMVIAGQKLSPLWQTRLLPGLFLITAISMGYSVVAFESLWSSRALRRPLETPILSKLSGIIGWLTLVFLVVRFIDVFARGAFGLAFAGDVKGNLFLLENVLYVLPALLLIPKNGRGNPRTIFLAALSLMLAGTLYRFNTFLIGYDPGAGWQYFPSLSEVLITLGVISVEVMAYILFVRKLPVLPEPEHA